MIEQLKTIREALEQAKENTTHGQIAWNCKEALTALTQLEAMVGEQEPVARFREDDRIGHVEWLAHQGAPMVDGQLLYTAPPAQQPQEPEMTPAFRSSPAYTVGFQDGKAQALAQQPQAEPDMRKVCETLGFDPTNHHNAAKCPYCRGQQPQAEVPIAVLEPASSYVQPVPDHCDRIVWRNHYYHLPLKQPQAEAVQKFVWGYAVRNPKEPQVPHKLAYYKTHADAQSLQFYCSEIIPLVAAAPQQAEAVPSDVVRDAERLDWLSQHDGRYYNIDRISSIVGTGFLTGPLNDKQQRHATLREAIDAAMAQGEKP